MTNLIVAGVIALLVAFLLVYVEFPDAIQTFIDSFPIQFTLFGLDYLIHPLHWLIVLLTTLLLTSGRILESLLITLIFLINIETIQAYARAAETISPSVVPLNQSESLPATITPPDSLAQPQSQATQIIETDLDRIRQLEPTTLNAPPGGHQGASPVTTSLLALGQGDPTIGHWNPYVHR